MKLNLRNGVLAVALATVPAGMWAMQAAQTAYTGVVSDDMCGVKHTMDAGHSDADCVRMCTQDNGAYALVVGQKAYTLDANAAQRATLNKLAAKRVIVKGTLKGDTLKVASVTPAPPAR
ncbi:MAG TPA: hypothetical protein VN709_03745 [Terriglobales bacterium]|nr:hypothetical protein [Terriglobales bacterium]